MFSGNKSISLDYDDDEMVNLCDFEFNIQLQTSLQDVDQIREFSKNIVYYNSTGDDQDEECARLWADDWFMVLDFVPFVDFYDFSLVCSLFAELLTFNRRYLVIKRILQEFPSLLKDSHFTSLESLRTLVEERSPTDDPSFSKSLYSDLIHFLIEKKRYKQNIWKHLSNEKVLSMDPAVFITPFRPSLFRKTFFDFTDIPQIIRQDKSFILKLFDSHTSAVNFYVFLSAELKADEDIIKKVVQRNGWFLNSVYSPTEEIVNLAVDSKCKYSVSTYYNPYQQTFQKTRRSLISNLNYRFTCERSILRDFRKSRTSQSSNIDYFYDILKIDQSHQNKHCEFLLHMAYFEKSFELKKVVLNYHNSKTTLPSVESYYTAIDLITAMLCFPERFDYLTIPMNIHESLKVKSKQITVFQIVKRMADEEFIFNNILQHSNFKLTKSSIGYLRERVIERGKVTACFSEFYFSKRFEKFTNCNDKNELDKFLTDISTNRKLNLKMLKYHPKYYSQLDESFKQNVDFIQIALLKMSLNAQYFDFSQDEMIVIALSANLKRTLRFFRKQSNWDTIKEQIKRIFLKSGKIREEWLTWPHVFRFYIYFCTYNLGDFSPDKLTMENKREMIQHVPPKSKKGMCDYFFDLQLAEKIGMKNLVGHYPTNKLDTLAMFKYCVSYKSHISFSFAISGYLTKYQREYNLLSEVLKQTPKFIKVLNSEKKGDYIQPTRVPDIPFDLIKELAHENPKIIHYLPKKIRKRLDNPFGNTNLH